MTSENETAGQDRDRELDELTALYAQRYLIDLYSRGMGRDQAESLALVYLIAAVQHGCGDGEIVAVAKGLARAYLIKNGPLNRSEAVDRSAGAGESDA